jgi:hypothetical protein
MNTLLVATKRRKSELAVGQVARRGPSPPINPPLSCCKFVAFRRIAPDWRIGLEMLCKRAGSREKKCNGHETRVLYETRQ